MKPFSLTAVLKYRKQLEDSAALKLAEAELEMQEAKKNLKSIEKENNLLISDLIRYQSTGMGIEDLLQYENRLSWLKVELQTSNDKFQASVKNVEQKRNNVIAKSRNKKVLERLKKKQNLEWQTYLNRKENAQLDEIAVLSHERKQKDKF